MNFNFKKKRNRIGSSEIAAGIGIGLLAGAVGTAVMTVAQMLDMKITGRESSDTPYKAVKKITGIEDLPEEKKEMVNNLTHLTYGTVWGIPRGIMTVTGMNGAPGTIAHFGAIWGTEVSLLPAMDVIEPVTKWNPKAISKDIMFHGIYALVTGLITDLLYKEIKKRK
ncbi:MAG: hypothetical protein ACNS64_11585 [Candidatus Halalkalibacterium sp. M3_1C_030]